ncbi:hypothetical protein M1P56_34915 (plasmid) [Streptomyces sp. HU2014]|uniref:MAB_1171c family putative transporter n=1 Tax=Streptomyces sp. HU2014 TaxID=2939414 RepID=UPI00200FE0D0|nr:MAB_1171c family putative transporter [Streptomyces sp. HU2014]UQI49711.1 hypothetical protein M1P56_34915 [Streptomyces sp. HU2014]
MPPALALVALGTALAWKLYQLYRDPSSRPLRAVTLCLAFAEVSYPLALPGGVSCVDSAAGDGAAELGRTVLLLAGSYFLMCFYLHSAADTAACKRRSRREGAVVTLVITAVTATSGYAPARALTDGFVAGGWGVPRLTAFSVITHLYLLYALATAGWWTCIYARKSSQPYAAGLWTAAAGLSGLAVSCAVRVVIEGLRWWCGRAPAVLMTGMGTLPVLAGMAVAVGITYPAARIRATAVCLWLRHRRLYRQLEPLWLLLTTAYPETVLHTRTAPGAPWGALRGVHLRCHRRIIECRDGLVRISPHIRRRALDDAAGVASPALLAQELRRAARAVERDLPARYEPVLLAVPSHGAADADVQQLVALSLALRDKPGRAGALRSGPFLKSAC